jgi:hypothetical protein
MRFIGESLHARGILPLNALLQRSIELSNLPICGNRRLCRAAAQKAALAAITGLRAVSLRYGPAPTGSSFPQNP